MRVVIQVRPRRDDPIDDPRLDERDDRRHPEARRRHGAGEAHADGDVLLEHQLREQAAPLGETRRVVGEERVVHQLGDRLPAGDRLRIDALAAQEIFACGHGTSASLWVSIGKAWLRRSRACRTVATASRGLSVTVNSRRSVVAIFPSPATRSRSQSTRPAQYCTPNRITGKLLTFPVWMRGSDSNNSSIV